MFIPVMQQILPYLNAFLMVLTEIINVIAKLFGYNEKELGDFGIGQANEDILDIGNSANKAGASVKKLKQGLRGFDKLNNITTPSKGAGGAGGGTGTGVDPKILDLFNKYSSKYLDNLDNISMKATRIRDKIMDILGFTKVIDPLTGKVSFKYNGWMATVKGLWNWFKKLNPQAKLIVGYLTAMGATKVITGISKVLGLFNKMTGISKLLTPFKSITGYIKNMIPITQSLDGKFKGLFTGITGGLEQWQSKLGIIDKFKIGLVGAGGLVASLGLVKSGISDIAKEGEVSFGSLVKTAGGAIGSITSGAVAGFSIGGPWGAAIGGAVGLVGTLITSIQTIGKYQDTNMADLEKNAPIVEEHYQKFLGYQKQLDDALAQKSGEFTYYELLKDELDNIVDKNGKVKEGYETRAEYITGELSNALGIEIELNNGIIKNYDTIKEKIDETIEKKKALAKLDILEQNYKVAMQEITEATNNLSIAEDKLKNANNNLGNAIDKLSGKKFSAYANDLKFLQKEYGITTEELVKYYSTGEKSVSIQKALADTTRNNADKLDILGKKLKNQVNASKTAVEQYNKEKEALDGYNKTIEEFNVALEMATQGNYEALNKYFDHERNLIGKSKEEQKNYWNDIISKADMGLESLKRNRASYSEETYNALKKYYEKQKTLANTELDNINGIVDEKLLEQTNNIKGEWTDKSVSAWTSLADKSEGSFLKTFAELTPDLQREVIDKMQSSGYKISTELQKGINKLNPKIKIDADTSKASTKVSDFLKGLGGGILNLSKFFSISGGRGFANGGLPPVGQLFVANEKGPELVGHIGGQSFVANQNQMMDLLDKKIGNAQGNKVSPTIIVQVGDKEIARQVLDNLQDMAKDNGKPITIG